MESKQETGALPAVVALPRDRWRQFAWRAIACTALALGAIGTLLPVVPTVPFVILAAWAAQRGWPQLEQWLLSHTTFGPHIHAWRARGAVPLRAKWLATAMMSASALMIALFPIPLAIKAVVWFCFVAVGLWLWTRPC